MIVESVGTIVQEQMAELMVDTGAACAGYVPAITAYILIITGNLGCVFGDTELILYNDTHRVGYASL